MQETYIDIMIQSLLKKLKVLDKIIEIDSRQSAELEQPDLSADAFDQTVEEKQKLIDQINQLDSGFDKLYERVKEELSGNKDQYADQIRTMQGLIRQITDKSMEIQAQEARNKELMMRKFAGLKTRARRVRTGYKAASQYYKNMNQTNVVDPQFLDRSK